MKKYSSESQTRAIKYAGGSADNAMEENIFSKYFESDDGLNLLRVDELYDSDSDGLDWDDIDAGAWRALWVGTYRPGSLGALLHKTVYHYPSLTATESTSQPEYTYTHDPVGNVEFNKKHCDGLFDPLDHCAGEKRY